MFDIITIGDSTLDVFVEIDEASVLCTMEKGSCVLCLSYADKIPVKKLTRVPGVGNAANVAVGAARLGLKTATYTVVGNDDIGKQICANFKKEKVAQDYVEHDQKRGTNYSVVINYRSERTILTYHEPRIYKLPAMKKSEWVYFTSISKNHGSLPRQIINYTTKHKTKLAFNPGTYQIRSGIKKIKYLINKSEVVFINKEEAKKLLGEKNIKDLLVSLYKYGSRIVVITDGSKGSYAYDGHSYYSMGIMPSKVYEKTGAGDSFATAFIAALHYKKGIDEALRWGAIESASVIEKIGAQEGLLTLNKLKKGLAKCPVCSIKALKSKKRLKLIHKKNLYT